jgi:2-C-methyl-D-erythritol 4-phosphate cytidylyltransferase
LDATSHSPIQPVWALVPAAGLGTRMGQDLPKQYLPLAGKTLLETTLDKLLALPKLSGVVVALNDQDAYWPEALQRHPLVHRVNGGEERANSVLNGLNYLIAKGVPASHWVLVHDPMAGQCCGGILGKPVADTLKRAAGLLVEETCDRSALWQAHTPQMFRLGELCEALQQALSGDRPITDEASAIEQWGGRVLLVEDQRDNIKVTHPEDLPLAEMILRQQFNQ